MDVRFSEEQQALRDSVAQVVDRLAPSAVGQLDDAERAARLDAAVRDSGWRELRCDRGDGEPLATVVEVAIVAEQLARGSADAAFTGPTLAAELRRLAGAPAATDAEAVLLASGLGDLACIGATGPRGDEVAIDAAGATSALTLVPDAAGHVLGTVAITVDDAADALDLTRPTARVTPGAAVTVLEGQQRPLTDADLTRWTALALALTSSDLVGTMTGAVELSREYAMERRQYKAPIGSFQAVQHMLANGLVSTEGSRSSALYAAWAVDALGGADALVAAAMAKAYGARAALAVCETAIQVHGGIGNTWECMAHVHLRRALLSSDVAGGVGPNLTRVLAANGLARPDAGSHGLPVNGDDHGLR